MSTNFPPGSKQPGSHSPYGYGQQPGYTGPASNASGSSGTAVMIVIALGVVILLGLACAGAAVGFLFFARASQSAEMMRQEVDVARAAARQEAQAAMKAEEAMPLQGDPPAIDPQRAKWSFPTSPEGASGSIAQQASGIWVETRSDNASMKFQEVARTAEYVELYDASRQLYVRLLPDHMEWRREGQEWFRGQDGTWDAASLPLPTSSEPLPTIDTQPPQP